MSSRLPLALALAVAAASPADAQYFGSIVSRDADAPDRFATRIETLDDSVDEPFMATTTADGRLRRLNGGRTRPLDVDGRSATERFVREHGAKFGAEKGWVAAIELFGEGGRAHVAFTRDGVKIDRVRLIVRLDGAAIVGVAAGIPAGTEPLGEFEWSQGRAAEAARSFFLARRTSLELRPLAGLNAQRVERRWLATHDGLVPTWAVEESTRAHDEAVLMYVDARDGSIAAVVELVDHGTGFYPQGLNLVPFKTKTGKGMVFKSVEAARNGVAKKVSLPDVAKGIPNISSPLAKGFVVSAHADTWDNNGNDPFDPSLEWNFDPFGGGFEFDNFDHVNVLYETEKFYAHLENAIGQPLATDFSLPFLLNILDPNPNAFFSTSTFPPDGHVNGFMGFNEVIGAQPQGDLSRDPTVVDHEYTHAWLAFEQLSFFSNLDEPPRAVNEAMADFFAVSHHQRSKIGEYTDDVFPGLGIGRELQDTDHFPETTVDARALTGGGLPEEHRNGEIFGSFLVDIRNILGTKKTEKRIFASLPAMPHQMSDIAFGTVTPGNSTAATEAFMVSCVAGLLTVAKNAKEAGTILGAATGRGLLGGPATSSIAAIDLEQQKKRKYTFFSGVHLAGTTQRVQITTKQGRKLKVLVKGEKNSGILPTFIVVADSGTPGAVTEVTSLTTKKSGRIAEQTFKLNDPNQSAYFVTVSAQSGTTGAYELILDA